MVGQQGMRSGIQSGDGHLNLSALVVVLRRNGDTVARQLPTRSGHLGIVGVSDAGPARGLRRCSHSQRNGYVFAGGRYQKIFGDGVCAAAGRAAAIRVGGPLHKTAGRRACGVLGIPTVDIHIQRAGMDKTLGQNQKTNGREHFLHTGEIQCACSDVAAIKKDE